MQSTPAVTVKTSLDLQLTLAASLGQSRVLVSRDAALVGLPWVVDYYQPECRH